MALALDWYFKIDDVAGDAAERQHQTWIETYSWKLHYKGAPIGVGVNRRKEMSLVLVAGTASARLQSAMQTKHRFMKAELHGVLNGNTVEGSEYVHLRVIDIIPGGRYRDGRLLEQVTLEYDVS